MQIGFADALSLIKNAVKGFLADNVMTHAAAMAFYSATALAPILLIVISIAGIAVGRDAAQLAVSAQLSGMLGPQGADLLQSVIDGAADTTKGTLAAGLAILTLLVSASGVFGEMQASLNRIWKVEMPAASFSSLVRARAASLGLVASLGFLLLVSLLASTAISALSDLINTRLPVGSAILSLLNTLVSLALTALLFGAIYRVLPDRHIAWRDIRFGAIVTAMLFTLGKSLIGWYLGTSATASSYGAAGSVIILLLWIFYSSAIFLLGAEITRAYAVSFGSRRDLRRLVKADDAAPSIQEPLDADRKPLVTVGAVAAVSAVATLIARSLLDRDGKR